MKKNQKNSKKFFRYFLFDLEEALIEPTKALAIVHDKNAHAKSFGHERFT